MKLSIIVVGCKDRMLDEAFGTRSMGRNGLNDPGMPIEEAPE